MTSIAAAISLVDRVPAGITGAVGLRLTAERVRGGQVELAPALAAAAYNRLEEYRKAVLQQHPQPNRIHRLSVVRLHPLSFFENYPRETYYPLMGGWLAHKDGDDWYLRSLGEGEVIGIEQEDHDPGRWRPNSWMREGWYKCIAAPIFIDAWSLDILHQDYQVGGAWRNPPGAYQPINDPLHTYKVADYTPVNER